jgi:protein-tyrosine-phosphatase
VTGSTVEIRPVEFLQLVAEPHRWQLLRELTKSDRRVGELTELLDEPQNLVSYHLSELRKAGLVSARRSSFDGRDTYYRVEPDRSRELLCSAGAALQPGLRLVPHAPGPVRIAGKPRVLFLCTGNSARSQIAEALLEHLSDGRIQARSAGSHPRTVHPNAVRVMAARGIDISGRRTKHLRRFERMRFDRVITLCDKVREVCPEFPGHPTAAHWSIADPAATGDASNDAFERTADDLEIRIRQLIAQMIEEDKERKAS